MADKEQGQPKFRNLKPNEKKQVILAFIEIIKNISINGKPFVVNATSKAIATNPQIPMEEIQKTLGVRDKTKLDFIRQLYIRSGNQIINQLFPDENILNLPVLSFESNGAAISLTY
jgi:hypothetical protein